MPIKVSDELPAVNFLRNENVFVMTSSRAEHQAIRPLKMLFLNLMPKKIETENQFLRLLSNSPLQVDVRLLRIDNHVTKNTPMAHLNSFYDDFAEIAEQNFDGLIITGAPLGNVEFRDVHYWHKIEEIINWAKEHVTSTLFACWAAQAGLKVLYNLPRKTLEQKMFGVFNHYTLNNKSPLTRGFDDEFLVPHSRYTCFDKKMIVEGTDLDLLAETETGECYLLSSKDKRQIYITGHPEYDAYTLAGEYFRDLTSNSKPQLPLNYFPQNNPKYSPHATWRSHAYLLYSNWLNYFVYQITPYDLSTMQPTLD